MHDDGEKDHGPDIASWSLGGAASMDFKIKSKYWVAKGLTPTCWHLPHSRLARRLSCSAYVQAPWQIPPDSPLTPHTNRTRHQPTPWQSHQTQPRDFGNRHPRFNGQAVRTSQIPGRWARTTWRTSAHRTKILNNQPFITAFTNEYINIYFGQIGRLNADDTNFITRWMIEERCLLHTP